MSSCRTAALRVQPDTKRCADCANSSLATFWAMEPALATNKLRTEESRSPLGCRKCWPCCRSQPRPAGHCSLKKQSHIRHNCICSLCMTRTVEVGFGRAASWWTIEGLGRKVEWCTVVYPSNPPWFSHGVGRLAKDTCHDNEALPKLSSTVGSNQCPCCQGTFLANVQCHTSQTTGHIFE